MANKAERKALRERKLRLKAQSVIQAAVEGTDGTEGDLRDALIEAFDDAWRDKDPRGYREYWDAYWAGEKAKEKLEADKKAEEVRKATEAAVRLELAGERDMATGDDMDFGDDEDFADIGLDEGPVAASNIDSLTATGDDSIAPVNGGTATPGMTTSQDEAGQVAKLKEAAKKKIDRLKLKLVREGRTRDELFAKVARIVGENEELQEKNAYLERKQREQESGDGNKRRRLDE